MFATDRAPGVYYEAVDAGSPPVTPLRTDITAIVGIAERGPVDLPVPVESWQQFVSWFGAPIAQGYLAYSVRGFFENGGRRCWVVRVASNDPLLGATCSSVELATAGGPAWRLRASSPGVWGDQLTVSVREMNRAQVYTTASAPDGTWSGLPTIAGFGRASLVRVTQSGSSMIAYKVASDVDAAQARLYWVNPEGGLRLPSDAPLTGFDPDRPVRLETVEYRLLVSERGRLVRVYEQLSLVPASAGYGPTVLGPLQPPIDPVTGAVRATAPEPIVVEELRTDPTAPAALDADPAHTLRLTAGSAGLAALVAYDFIGEPIAPDDSDLAAATKRRGLRTVEHNSEIGLLAVPDIVIQPEEINPTVPPPPCVPDPCLDEPAADLGIIPTLPAEQPPVFSEADVFRVQAAMVAQCEDKRDRFAVLDPPYRAATDLASGIRGALDWRALFDTSFAALNYPWLKVADPLAGPGAVRLIPPSGHVAGIMAATDLEVGVHHAPANRRVAWSLGASVLVGDEHHAVLNQGGVNVARTVGGRGLRLLGARTVSSDPDWRYVNVRRLMAMIEKALGIALQWAVFEPNGFLTRARATMSVTFFLDALHEAGMLAGHVAEESFYVKCDLDNNPPEQRDLGELIIEVGVAPAEPFEFVVLRVGRVYDSIEVRESTGWIGVR